MESTIKRERKRRRREKFIFTAHINGIETCVSWVCEEYVEWHWRGGQSFEARVGGAQGGKRMEST